MQRVAKYLYLRNGRYTFRRAIPKDVQKSYGKTEDVVSLGDVTEARARALTIVHSERCGQIICRARVGGKGKAAPDELFRTSYIPDQEEIEREMRHFVADMENVSSATSRIGRQEIGDRSRELDFEESDIIRIMTSGTGEPPMTTRWIADTLIHRNGWTISKDSRLDALILDRVARGQRELIARQRSEINWSDPSGPTHRIFTPEEFAKDSAFPRRGNAAQSRLPLLAIVDKWAAERDPRAKTIRKTRVIITEFDALTRRAAIGAITPDHVQTYKEQLVATCGSKATANNKLNLLRAVIRFARENRIITSDPCEGVSIKLGKSSAKARTIYDRPDLEALFATRVWASDFRPMGGRGEASYWLPLLALYTGARLEELGQLRLIDIAKETYLAAHDVEAVADVICIVADEADGLTLKSEKSQRRVPIHSQLVQLGFLQYVDQMRLSGALRLFPELRPDRDGTRTAAWSKWYGRWLRAEAGIADRRVTFHSFRHSFKHYARQSGLPPDAQNEITGHETGDVADQYGGLSYPLFPLVQAIEHYRVPGFVPPDPPGAV